MSRVIIGLSILSVSLSVWAEFHHQMSQEKNKPNELVRVRIEKKLAKIEITGENIQIQGEDQFYKPVAIKPYSLESFEIEKVIKLNKFFWRVTRKVISGEKIVQLYGANFLSITGRHIQSAEKSLPNQFFLYGKQKFDLVGVVPLHEYIIGVLSKEMPASWPLETLKAQAVAAKSYAVNIMKERKQQYFQLESTTMDQVFENVSEKKINNPQFSKIMTAVSETENLFLFSKSGKILKAYYHSDCGGKTSSSVSVFGLSGITGGAIDSSCPSNPNAKWVYKLKTDQFSQVMTNYFKSPFDLLKISDVKFRRKQENDRIDQVIFHMPNGSIKKIPAHQLRELLGFNELRSTQFSVTQEKDEIIFKGLGFGHGVGLCQWGAKALAKSGLSFDKILAHYYPEAILNKYIDRPFNTPREEIKLNRAANEINSSVIIK